MLAEHLLDGVGGISRVVEWNTGNVVVENVSFDDVMENMLSYEAELSIDGGSSPLGKVPLRIVVMRKSRVCVLKERHKHKPVIHPEPRHKPVDGHVKQTKLPVPEVDTGGYQS
ncbi:hypothetical protein OGATHE_000975 [Ogataea polymorpha]|uniref:Uncharacterized protein n=1 Tax=Ogataea polymorpha TaxID=460523 RepID=A0A9P8PSK9_9ASCO|nr:hypothetical protein OGATHE_000975 [Ogataea polymorpha]